MIKLLLNLLIILLAVFFVIEIIFAIVLKSLRYIQKNGLYMLNQELTNCELNSFSKDQIRLNSISDLKGRFISHSLCTPLFPYNVVCDKDMSVVYRVLRFSKAYYLIRSKYKEFKDKGEIPRKIKFK